jgi:hypothetical protein
VRGKKHPNTIKCVSSLAHLLESQGRYGEATALYQRACDGYSTILGDGHPRTRACRADYLDMLAKLDMKASKT